MRNLYRRRTGTIAVIGLIAFVVFALPWTPNWLSWLSLAVSLASLGRLIVVGDRRHYELRDKLDLDNDDGTSRAARLIDVLEQDDRK